MNHLSQRIENLSPTKRALLEKKLREKTSMTYDMPTITPRKNRERAPLAFNQESLWFLEQLNPNSSLYNLYDALRLQGAINLAALQKTLEEIVARHESLRTSLVEIDGEPQQIIAPPTPLPFQLLEVWQLPEGERETAAQKILWDEAHRPFTLAHGPLVRFTLVKLCEQEHILFVLMHHIISDGWSLGVFWQEFTQLYEHCAHDRPTSLPALPIQFADYAVWSRVQLRGHDLEQQLAYWKHQLTDAPALLELPTDRPRPAVQSFRGAQQIILLPDELREALKTLSQQAGVTLFMTLLAAFYALLARYTGQDDLVIGSPLAGRTRIETENLIGFFVNTLALRTDVSGNPTFRDLLKRVRDTTLGAYANQDLAFEKLVAELRPERSLSYNPIFQTAFSLLPATTTELKITGIQLTPVKIAAVTAKFDLYLSLGEVPEGLRATIEYNTDLFDATTIERLLQHYQNLLTGIVTTPTQRISDLPLLSAAEQQQILHEWNDTDTAYPRDVCIHQLFETKAASIPDAVAVVSGDINLTFRELNRRANQVAHALRAQGVKPDTLVGIFMDRSLLMVIGVLGILKAGGAYLPLDPSYPKARLKFMLDDAQAPVILTQQKLLASLPETSTPVICLDSDWGKFSHHSESNPVNQTQPDNLAYVIYTSGSTGEPKGTAIPHRAVNRLVFNTNYVQIAITDCIAQVSNISFDAATFELWGALLHGAKLILINKDIALSPKEFVAQLRAHEINTMFLTTALFNLLAREVPTAFSTLKTLMFGGEACDPQAIRDVLKNGAPERLLHVYGPTESTTFATWHLVTEVPEHAPTVPIGRPLSNTKIYILDRHLNPVPIGVPGEIFIGGDGLARGYLNRLQLTQEKFLPIADCGFGIADEQKLNPQSAIRNPQLYKTGDLARYLPDGSIEFIGRKDHQIKLRGFRIELGEIETALLTHPALQDCVVTIAQQNEDKRLIAYYVAASQIAPTNDELREFLRQRLPDYMLPAAYCRLDALPLNANGKVDRQKLPTIETIQRAAGQDLARPQDELELRLTWIWEKFLGVKPIGVHDNFFALGGHSLIAVRLFTAIEIVFGKRFPLATLFQAPTIAQLANIIRQHGWQPSWDSLVALRPGGTKPPFFCVHAVGGNVLEYNDLARYLEADQPFYGLQAAGLQGQSTLTSIEEMATQYIREIRQIQPQGPYHLGGRSFGGSVAFAMAQQLHEQGEQVALLAMLDTYPLGWLKLLPEAEAQRYKKEFFNQRIKHHLANLARRSLPQKVHYILDKAKYKKRKYKNWWWKLQQKFGLGTAISLNHTLRNIEEINYLAAKKYVPQVYAGKVTFFCAEEEVSVAENLTGWQKLAGGGVEVITIPGDHQTMIKEPHVQRLAECLTACLHQASTSHESEK